MTRDDLLGESEAAAAFALLLALVAVVWCLSP